MTLYTKKKGEFVPMTRDQVRRLRRVSEVNALVANSEYAARTLRALVGWMGMVERRHNKIGASDMSVVALPNRDRLNKIAGELEQRADQIRKM